MIFSTYIFLYIITKNYGYDFVGNFSLVQAIFLTLSTICVLGLDTLSVKLVPLNKEYLKYIYFKILITILPLILLISLFLYFYSNTVAYFFSKIELSYPIKILSISLLPLSLININSEFFRGMKNMFYYSIYNKSSILLVLLFLLFLLSDNFYLTDKKLIYLYYLYSIILLAIFSSFHLFFKYLINSKISIPHNNNLKEKNLFSLSNNMLIINIVFIVFQFIDIILLGILSSSSDVGIYTILLKISSVTSIILLGVNSISGPIISKLFSSNQLFELNQYIKAIVRASTLLSIPIFFVIFIYSEAFLLLFGENLLIYKNALYLMCLAQLINILSGSVGLIMQMTNNEKIFKNIIIISLIVNMILSLALIPKYGVWGAVFSSSLSLVLWNILSIIFIKKKINIYSFIR